MATIGETGTGGRSINPATWACWGVFVLSCLVWGIAYLAGVPIKEMVRDPASQFGIPIHAGAFSVTGIGVLAATAALAAVAVPDARGADRRAPGLTAALGLVLAADDAFLLHDEIGPEIVGIPELAFYALYAAGGLWLYLTVRRHGPPTARRALEVGGYFLAFSVLLDVFKVHGPFSFWLEDFTKLAGFVGLLCYAVIHARAVLRGGVSR